MAVSILEALMNADINIGTHAKCGQGVSLPLVLGAEQLHNATVLLEKGYDIRDEVEPLLEQYGSIDAVPEKSG